MERIKVQTPRGIVYCEKQKTGLYKTYNTAIGGKSKGILNLDYVLKLNDGLYVILPNY